MRLFIAIDLDKGTRVEMAGVIEQLGSKGFDVKWVDPDNIHITLKFLGDVHESRVNGIKERVSAVLKGVKGFRISISELGYFGSPGHVRVIWLDVLEGRERLVELSKLLSRELGYIMKQDHEPSPHITIGRVRSGRNREELVKEIEKLKHVKIGEVDVNRIILKKSVLGRDGPIYSDLEVFPLE